MAPDQLQNEVRDLARAITRGPLFSHTRIKALAYEGPGGDVAGHMARQTQAMAECFKSSGHQEGVAPFLERRDPNFTGA